MGLINIKRYNYGREWRKAESASESGRTRSLTASSSVATRQSSSGLGSVLAAPSVHQTLKKGFEGIGNTMSDYNAFVQANANVVRVYVPKQVRLNGGCVLAPYQITRGKLPSIVLTKDGEERLVTDIALGGMVISEATSVAALAGMSSNS